MAQGKPASGVRKFKPRSCAVCSTMFVPTSSKNKHCSEPCREKFNKKYDREYMKQQRSLGYKVSPEYLTKWRRTEFGKVGRKLEAISRRAKKAGRPFSLTRDWFYSQWQAQQGRCALTGFPMVMFGQPMERYLVSVDRIDPSMGYAPDNCRLVCYVANFMRGNLDDAELRVWLRAMLHGLDWREGRTWR